MDANVPVYAATREPPRGDACSNLMSRIAGGADGRTSVTVIEEVLHLELTSRAGAASGLARRTFEVFAPLLTVTDEALLEALDLDTPRLGANDRIHVATCRLNGIDTIVSADAGFDSVSGLTRIDPLDQERIRRLTMP